MNDKDIEKMKKINVAMYGGKSIFGGKETRLNVDIAYCDKYDKCSFYREGKCFNAGRWKANCKIGKKENVVGYTSRAIKYNEFKKQWKNDETYNKLDEPESTVGIVDDMVILNIPYMKINELDKPEENVSLGFTKPISYILLSKFTPKMIDNICKLVPRTIFENAPIRDYKEKHIPHFLDDLKRNFPSIYKNFIKEYPEYKEKEINYIGRNAYINSLKDGTEIKDTKGNFIKNGLYLESKSWKSAFLPFEAKEAELRIKITEQMTVQITNNSQVDENTKFKN